MAENPQDDFTQAMEDDALHTKDESAIVHRRSYDPLISRHTLYNVAIPLDLHAFFRALGIRGVDVDSRLWLDLVLSLQPLLACERHLVIRTSCRLYGAMHLLYSFYSDMLRYVECPDGKSRHVYFVTNSLISAGLMKLRVDCLAKLMGPFARPSIVTFLPIAGVEKIVESGFLPSANTFFYVDDFMNTSLGAHTYEETLCMLSSMPHVKFIRVNRRPRSRHNNLPFFYNVSL